MRRAALLLLATSSTAAATPTIHEGPTVIERHSSRSACERALRARWQQDQARIAASPADEVVRREVTPLDYDEDDLFYFVRVEWGQTITERVAMSASHSYSYSCNGKRLEHEYLGVFPIQLLPPPPPPPPQPAAPVPPLSDE